MNRISLLQNLLWGTFLLGMFFSTTLNAQPLINHIVGIEEFGTHENSEEIDKCGPLDEKLAAAQRLLMGDHWGYGYDSLLIDLDVWKKSPYVATSVIGQSVQGRDIYELTITSDQPSSHPRHTISVHARTHPMETQSTWVCNEMIRFLLSDDPYAVFLRDQCVFHIIPMYNPDGVELTTTRYNANGVDLEREWDKENPEPEAAALKRRYSELMHSEAPIEIALNLHSSSDGDRYFWYHHETGTSVEYTHLEQKFTDDVRRWFSGIVPFYYYVSWINETPTHFPESWFWLNYGTSVMALTYEDIFEHKLDNPEGHFDSTAWALLRGIGDYLNLQMPSSVAGEEIVNGMQLTVFDGTPTRIRFALPSAGEVHLIACDALGREIAELTAGEFEAGTHEIVWESGEVPSGTYFVRLESGRASLVKRAVVVR